MHGADGQQRGDDGVLRVGGAVAQDDIVDALLHRFFGLLADAGQGAMQACAALGGVEHYGNFQGLEALVADIAQDVELRIAQNGMW